MNPIHDSSTLLALDVLLETRSVTLSARRLGVTQSAMSHTLKRLRERLGDPLLVRSGRSLVPTARADAMAKHLRIARTALAEAVAATPTFDPATARRTFRVATTDLVEMLALPRVLARLETEAPGVDLHVRTQADAEVGLLAGELDLSLHPLRDQPSAGLRAKALFHERFVVLLRKGHPLTRKKLTVARFAAARHVLVAPRGKPGGVVDDVLAERGLVRRTAVLVPSFLSVPHLVAGTDLVATLPEGVARTYARQLPLRILEHPLSPPGFTISLVWHERDDADPGHQWVRKLFTRSGPK